VSLSSSSPSSSSCTVQAVVCAAAREGASRATRRRTPSATMAAVAAARGVLVVALLAVVGPGCALLQLLAGPPVEDTVVPAVRDGAGPRVLVLTKTHGYRHASIADAVTATTAAAHALGAQVVVTDSAAFAREDVLAGIDVVVFAHANGTLFTAEQQAAFARWLEGGGGLLLLHGAVGDWWPSSPWFRGVVGARFVGHTLAPSVVGATVRRRVDHPASARLPATFLVEDELYSFAEAPAGERTVVLAELDERSAFVGGFLGAFDLTMGKHPIVWARSVGRGRVIVDALGHTPESWRAAWVGPFLEDALAWLARRS
jgi:type 1 glutamine amidotransferase